MRLCNKIQGVIYIQAHALDEEKLMQEPNRFHVMACLRVFSKHLFLLDLTSVCSIKKQPSLLPRSSLLTFMLIHLSVRRPTAVA